MGKRPLSNPRHAPYRAAILSSSGAPSVSYTHLDVYKRQGKGSSDAYLADWQRSAPKPCGEDLQAEASAEAARLEAKFTDEDLERLVRSKGLDETRSPPDPGASPAPESA